MAKFRWSETTALWQVTHGEMGTEKTESAFRWLDRVCISAPGVALGEAQDVAGKLLDAIRELRGTAPEPDLRAHVRELHPRLAADVPAAELARRHAAEHFQFGSQSHHHGPNAGPHARPKGWRDGSGVVLIDLRASRLRPPRPRPDQD
jgi:hypothetical protein